MTSIFELLAAKIGKKVETIHFLISVSTRFIIMLAKTELIVSVLLYVTALGFFIIETTGKSRMWYEKVKRRI